jgi:hypothetical protein
MDNSSVNHIQSFDWDEHMGGCRILVRGANIGL